MRNLFRNGAVGFVDWLDPFACKQPSGIAYGKANPTDDSHVDRPNDTEGPLGIAHWIEPKRKQSGDGVGKHDYDRDKISYRARQRASLQVEGCSYAKQGNRTGRG